MVSFKIKISEDERNIRVTSTAPFFYIILGLMFITLQVMLFPAVTAGNDGKIVFLLFEFIFLIIFYVIASWCPLRIYLEKDKQERLLRFFAAPGCWKKKIYPLINISSLIVEDDGEWMGTLYVFINGERRKIYSGFIFLVRELASKAGEVFNIKVESY